jgi:hypothetical protein
MAILAHCESIKGVAGMKVSLPGTLIDNLHAAVEPAALLNDAYEAGVKKAMTEASVYITDLGDLVTGGDSPFNTTNRLSAARAFYESYWGRPIESPSPILITPETMIPYPCWLFVTSSIADDDWERYESAPDYVRYATHYLPDSPNKPTVVP